MSNLGLFVIGAVVALLVAASMTLLVWGGILDGRYDDERRAEEEASARITQDQALQPLNVA